jgi:serine protease
MAFAVNPDLPLNRLTDPRDFAFLDPSGPVLDMDGHGSHVAGTIAQETNNGLLLAGLAYNARIMPVKVCNLYWELMIARAQANTPGFLSPSAGGCPIVDIADGIRYAADRGAKVMNISLSGTGSQEVVREALNYAVSRGAFVATSMGNDYEQGNPVMYPARYAQDIMGVMSVGAVGKTQARSYYSSTGAHNEIAAPGGDTRVGGGPGATDLGRVWQSAGFFPDFDPLFIRRPNFNRYDAIGIQGTSMASPHVAGLAALLAAQSPGITPANIERAIRATARDLGTPGKDNDFGYGLIQPRSTLFGWGLRK